MYIKVPFELVIDFTSIPVLPSTLEPWGYLEFPRVPYANSCMESRYDQSVLQKLQF
jgi:hypothetical protein